MSSYLRNLVARTIGSAGVVRPSLAPRFLAGRGERDDAGLHAAEPSGYTRHARPGEPPDSATTRGAENRPTAGSEAGASTTGEANARASRSSALAPSNDRSHRSREPNGPEAPPPEGPARDGVRAEATAKPSPSSRSRASTSAPPPANADAAVQEAHAVRAAQTDAARTFGELRPGLDHPSSGSFEESETGSDAQAGVDPRAARAGAFSGRERHAIDVRARSAFDAANSRRHAEPAGKRAAERERTAPEPQPARDETIINVTIGRIEVRTPEAPRAKTPLKDARPAAAPSTELEAYLRGRNGARR
jgi:hypothetical protein